MTVPIMKMKDEAIIPRKGSDGAAGYDLCACFDEDGKKKLWPHETLKVPTGIAVAIPTGYFGAIFARSGLATKQGLRPANCVGVIDSDYRGEISVALYNDSNIERDIYTGDRIAQLVIIPYKDVSFEWVDSLPETKRGDGGFGSTGISNENIEQLSLFSN